MRPLIQGSVMALCLASMAFAQSGSDAAKEAANKSNAVKSGLAKRPDGKWVPSKMTATQLAQRTAKAVMALQNTEARTQTLFQTADGRGQIDGLLRVANNGKYYIDFVTIDGEPFTGTMVARNGQRQIRRDEKITVAFPVNQAIASARSEDPAAIFFREFPRIMYRGITERKDAWVPLVAGLGKQYKLRVDERRMTYKGQNFISYRISGAKTGAQRSSFEITIDGKFFLPVTVRTERKDAKGKDWITQWAAMYQFKQRFSDAQFTLKAAR
jgi:hypothetical protein